MLRQFEGFLRRHGFGSVEEAVRFQKEASGDDRYRIVDLLIEHVREKGGTHRSMNFRYNAVRSFFLYARAELPRVKVNFRPDRDETVGRLSVEVLRRFLRAGNLRSQAIYLTLFQGLMDQHRFTTVFNRLGRELSEHLQTKGVDHPFRINILRGRKGNYRAYNTWIGRDALEAWKVYFESTGFPRGEAVLLSRYGKPLSKAALRSNHEYLLRKLGYIKGYGNSPSVRYGYGLHELRDLARSILEKARKDGFNPLSAEYWMGHIVDPLFYNKIWKLDPEYNLNQYRIAEKYLNILSQPSGEVKPEALQELEHRIRQLEQLVDMLEGAKPTLTR